MYFVYSSQKSEAVCRPLCLPGRRLGFSILPLERVKCEEQNISVQTVPESSGSRILCLPMACFDDILPRFRPEGSVDALRGTLGRVSHEP